MKTYLFIIAIFISFSAVANEKIRDEFVSPDGGCKLRYIGASGHGEGAFYDIARSTKKEIYKGYLRYGPSINWISNTVAEIYVREGSHSYHSYYYGCKNGHISPPYYLPIAVNIKSSLVATLENEKIAFYTLFASRPFFTVEVPEVNLVDYLNSCESEAVFWGERQLNIEMRCYDGRSIKRSIDIPN